MADTAPYQKEAFRMHCSQFQLFRDNRGGVGAVGLMNWITAKHAIFILVLVWKILIFIAVADSGWLKCKTWQVLDEV